MKFLYLLFASSLLLLTSCSEDHPPLNSDLIPNDSALPSTPKPTEPELGCFVQTEKTGTLTGEWLEIGSKEGVISEVDCIPHDTAAMASRDLNRWVFKNDSLIYTYSGKMGRAYYFKVKGKYDTITMVDDHHMFYDTLLVTRLDPNYMIVSSLKQLPKGSSLGRRSALYMRR